MMQRAVKAIALVAVFVLALWALGECSARYGLFWTP